MSINDEFMRLNYYKRPKEYIQSEVQINPFAYDYSYNIFTVGEVTDYEAINVSITNILLSLFGQWLFELGEGSSLGTAVFENFESESYAENVLDTVIREIQSQETRITINKTESNLLIDFDNNAITFLISYIVNQSGIESIFEKKIII